MAGAAARSGIRDFAIGAAVMAAGIAGFAALDHAIAASTEFSKSIALVATEADAAAFSQDEMKDIAHELAGTYGKMPVDQAKAMYEAVGLGASNAAETTSLLTAANKLAVAGNAELTTSTDALGGALKAYGGGFQDAEKYADAMFVAMTSGKTTVQALAASLGRVTTTAAAYNVSFEEVTAAVSTMTAKNVEAGEAVSGLKAALASVVVVTPRAAAEAGRLGIKFDQATLRAKGLQGFLGDIMGSKKFNNESFSKLFGSVEGSNAILQITGGSMKDFNATLEKMKKGAGATSAGFDIMSQTLAFQEDRFKALSKSATILVGEALEPMKARTVGVANAVLTAFTNIPGPIMTAIVRVAAGAAAVAVGLGGVATTIAAVKLVVVALGTAGLAAFGAFVVAMAPAIVVLGAATLAFYALRQAYQQNLGGLGDFITNGLEKVTLAWRAVVSVFTTGGFSGALLEELDKAGNAGVLNFAINLYVWGNRIVSWWKGIIEGFQTGIAGASPTFERLVAALESLGKRFGFLSAEVDTLANRNAMGRAFADGESLGTKLANAAIAIVNGIARAIEEIDRFADVMSQSGVSTDDMVKTVRSLTGSLSILTGGWGSNGGAATSWGVTVASVLVQVLGYIERITAGFAMMTAGIARAKNYLSGNKAGLEAARIEYDEAALRARHGNALIHYGEEVGKGVDPKVARAALDDSNKAILASEAEIGWRKHLNEPIKARSGVAEMAGRTFAYEPGTLAAESAPSQSVDEGSLFATMAAAAAQGGGPTNISANFNFSVDGEQLVSKVEQLSFDRKDRASVGGGIDG